MSKSRKIGSILIYSFVVIALKTILEIIKHPNTDKVSFLGWSFVFGFLLAAMNGFDIKVSIPSLPKVKFRKSS